MKKTAVLLACATVFFSSCGSTPAPVTDPVPPRGDGNSGQQTVKADDDVVVRFDTVAITKSTFESTKSETQAVVEELNRITMNRDYDRWLTYLSKEYYDEFSHPDTLEKVSASLPTKGLKLRNLRDYFTYVFVPSRQNMRVDDIQFVSPTRVYVIMEIAPGSPAAIYILEKTDKGWKLVPKNL